MKRFLLLIAPDKRTTALGFLLVALTLVLGVMDLLQMNFKAAWQFFYWSLGGLTFLFVQKFLGIKATQEIAEDVHRQIQTHRQHQRHASGSGIPVDEHLEAAQQRREMLRLAGQLREALSKMEEDSPLRPKYEASLEWIKRAM